jgi:2-oxoglutarate ferredoxin oxidoreductase subunit beta
MTATKVPNMPKSWRAETKPHKFCPGCGHGLVLKALGEAIDELGIQDRVVFGCDIGCSLLSWDFFNVDAIQTHHGRTTPVMTGIKQARPDRICIAYMGDGGGYELTGAVNAGMRAVLIRTNYDRAFDKYQPEAKGWEGPAISDLRELLSMLN